MFGRDAKPTSLEKRAKVGVVTVNWLLSSLLVAARAARQATFPLPAADKDAQKNADLMKIASVAFKHLCRMQSLTNHGPTLGIEYTVRRCWFAVSTMVASPSLLRPQGDDCVRLLSSRYKACSVRSTVFRGLDDVLLLLLRTLCHLDTREIAAGPLFLHFVMMKTHGWVDARAAADQFENIDCRAECNNIVVNVANDSSSSSSSQKKIQPKTTTGDDLLPQSTYYTK
jgi:hypothetical protein